MAQQKLFSFPVGFDFMVVPSKWTAKAAGIEGWWQTEHNTSDLDYLAAVTFDANAPERFRIGIERLPEEIFDACYSAGPDASDEEIQEICSGFSLEVLVNAIPGSDYEQFHLKHALAELKAKQCDPWEMRSEFIEMNPDTLAALAFLNKWGRWGQNRFEFARDIIRSSVQTRKDVLSDDHGQRGSIVFLPDLQRIPRFPHFVVRTASCEKAIRTTLLADFVNGIKFKACARPDCGKAFSIESKHAREYCTQYCAHLESVRRNRKLKRRK